MTRRLWLDYWRKWTPRQHDSYLTKLPAAQRTKRLRTLSQTPPEDDTWLYWWLRQFYGLTFPTRACCQEHTATFKILADAFFARHPVTVVKGSRGLAGKSLLFGVAGSLRAALKHHEVNIFGGSGEQSKNVQKYLTGAHPKMGGLMWDHARAPRHLISGTTATEARFHGGGVARALNASQTHARGGHPNLVIGDEIDEMPFDILEAILGQPQGVEAGALLGSTHQHDAGTMTDTLEMAEAKGWPVHEVCHRCNHVSNGGWLTDEMIALKKATMTPETWRVEVELQEPNPQRRVFTLAHLEVLFDPDWGEFPDSMGLEYEVIPPSAPGTYTHDADWGRKRHNTCIPTPRRSDLKWPELQRRSMFHGFRCPETVFGLPFPGACRFGGGLRQREKARQAFHGRPVAFDLDAPGPEGYVEVAPLVDERAERVYVRLDPRDRVSRRAVVHPDAPVLHLEPEGLTVEHQLVAGL